MTSHEIRGRIVAVIGGDERECEIARLAAASGATTRAFGFPAPRGGISGVTFALSAAEAIEGAHYALFPIPGIAVDGALFAPKSAVPIIPDVPMLRRMSSGAAIILGQADVRLRAAAETCGITLIEYEDDAVLMCERGPAIVEGTIAQIVANTPLTIHGTAIGVVGHGTIGRLLARTLVLLGARVHVFARNPLQRADAVTAGCTSHPLADLPGEAPSLPILISTIPAAVVGHQVLKELAPGSLVVDLAAPPGGVDLPLASAMGHRVVWARGMGASAPVSVGRSQWNGIAQRIAAMEKEKEKESLER